ncbi:MAG TPA: aminotransferase class I/II-fold pyridoxal phosphate-dependent enzyme [Vicinamibacteria bacterium]|nr:aminotransferase class I/II-fold pyridoxal phosphate-dependent enzyme [Vicinamibacteria bacterium]
MSVTTPEDPALADAPSPSAAVSGLPPAAHGEARWDWWEWWIERKELWVRDADPQLDSDVFRTISAGTGLPPVHQRSNFSFRSARDGARRFAGLSSAGERPYSRVYTRLGNPTTEYLERVMLQLEAHHVVEKALAAGEREPTIGSLIFSSGMAAISTVLLSLLRQGDAVLLGSVYGSTDSFARALRKFGVEAVFCDTSSLGAVEQALALRPDVAAVLLESPENPTLRIADIRRISWLTEARGIPLVVDNTFCSPYLQQPFRLGADFVVHSLTKFVNGHSTSVAGAVLGPFRFMRAEMFAWYRDLGPSPSPFESWLNALCVQDLAARVEAQCATAERLAWFLRRHPKLARVYYPGFPDFAQARLVGEQMRRGGSLIAFELVGGQPAAEAVMDYFGRSDTPMELAVSLGSAISYIQHPASMTHAGVPEEARRARGITPGLVRLSVGLEGARVLEDHLRRALDRA